MNINFIFPREDVNHIERDHFLTERMGLCWHEYDLDKSSVQLSVKGHVCTKCGDFFFNNNDFSSEEDFMKLLQWATDQDALSPVVSQFESGLFTDRQTGQMSRKRFADILYALLSMKRRKKKNVRQ